LGFLVPEPGGTTDRSVAAALHSEAASSRPRLRTRDAAPGLCSEHLLQAAEEPASIARSCLRQEEGKQPNIEISRCNVARVRSAQEIGNVVFRPLLTFPRLHWDVFNLKWRHDFYSFLAAMYFKAFVAPSKFRYI